MEQTTFLQYLEYERRFSPHTLIAYKSDLNQFATYLQNVYEINEAKTVRHAHIRSWIVELIGQGCANRSINRKLSSLKAYFRFLRKRGYIDHNPMLKVIAPKMGKRLPVFVREDRLADLFSQIEFSDDYAGMRSRMILELLYSTGMRRSELIQLKLADLSFQQQYLKVLGKGNKERLIPFGDRLAASLKAYLALREATFSSDSTYLFLTDKGRPLYPKLVYNLVKQYLSQVTTVEQRSPHVLRHSFATHLSNNGADLNAIKELLGHANLAATQIYTHNSIEKLKKVYQQAHPKADADKA